MKARMLAILLGAAIFAIIYFRFLKMEFQSTASLEDSIATICSMAVVDVEYTAQKNKILSIINRHNRSIGEQDKEKIAKEIIKSGLIYSNLSVDLICAVITHESANTWNPRIVSPAGAIGLMQIMPNTGMLFAVTINDDRSDIVTILSDPIANIKIGCYYLDILIGNYGVDVGLAAYNGGEAQARRWMATNFSPMSLCTETRNYVPAIITLCTHYNTL